MSELKRIYSFKTIFLFAALIIINTGLFMLSCNGNKDITLTGAELESYISEYPDYLKKTQENSSNMSLLNMYRDGFAADNIEKTAQAYKNLENINVQAGDNRGVVLLIDYKLTDIFLIAFLMIVAVSFLKERKKGIVYLVRSSKNGRGMLYFKRVGVLFLSAFAAGILLYGGNLLGMLISMGECDFSRAIQSLPEFMQCPLGISIGEYFILSVVLKIFTCFIAAFIFYLFISLMGTAAAFVLTAVTAVTELLLYILIIPVSSVNVFKYVNIFAIINCRDFLSVCCNLNIFGNAVSALFCNMVFLAFLFLSLICTGFLIHGKMYVKNTNPFERIIEVLSRISERFSVQRSLLGWEAYKLLIKQGGVFFIAAAFSLTLWSATEYDYVHTSNYQEELWYEEFEGEITMDSLLSAENEFQELETKIEKFQKRIDDMLKLPNYSQSSMDTYQRWLSEAQFKRDALKPVLESMRQGYDYYVQTGISVDLIKPYTYELLLENDEQSRNRASLYILLGIIMAVSGVYAYDRQNNMKNTIKCAYRGGWQIIVAKTACVFAVCIITSIAVHLIQLIQVGNLLEYNNLNSPVQSLDFMREFTLQATIKEYLVMLFMVRAGAACLIGLICMLISRLCSDTVTSMGVSVFVLAVPSVFGEFLATGNKLSFVYLLGGMYFR